MAVDITPSISIYTDANLVTAVPFSASIWFNSDNVTADYCLFSLCDKDSDYIYWALSIRGAVAGDYIRAEARIASGGDGAPAISSAGYSAGVWNHAGGVWSAANARAVYLNGGNKGTNSTSIAVSAIDRMGLAALVRLNDAQFLDGKLAEFGLWNVALTDADFAMLALGFSPLVVKPDSLVRYIRLIDTTYRDLVMGDTLAASGAGDAKYAHPRMYYPW
jgi:hypothetical protein